MSRARHISHQDYCSAMPSYVHEVGIIDTGDLLVAHTTGVDGESTDRQAGEVWDAWHSQHIDQSRTMHRVWLGWRGDPPGRPRWEDAKLFLALTSALQEGLSDNLH